MTEPRSWHCPVKKEMQEPRLTESARNGTRSKVALQPIASAIRLEKV
jgi:hypothetical protein